LGEEGKEEEEEEEKEKKAVMLRKCRWPLTARRKVGCNYSVKIAGR
jgi:hypothetical protein